MSRCLPALVLAVSALATTQSHAADGVKPLSLTQGRWMLVCDNTRHCEAAGFDGDEPLDDEEDEGSRKDRSTYRRGVVLWLSRDGGPSAPLEVALTAEFAGGDGKLTLEAEDGAVLYAGRNGRVPTEAFLAMLPALLELDTAKVSDGKLTGFLSLHPLAGILQSIDEAQGRIGTPGALYAKGERPESSVPPAVAAIELKRLPIVPNRADDVKWMHRLLPKLDIDDCDVSADVMRSESKIRRVSPHQAVVLLACERGQHANAYTLWLVQDKKPYVVRQLTLPDLDGREYTSSTSMLFDGRILNIADRQIPGQDCGSTTQWLWNGKGFTLASIKVTPLCNGMPGGSDMPFYTTKY